MVLQAELTPREREVLGYYLEGVSRGRMATMLAVSPHTVRNYVFHIMQKTETHNRYELTQWAKAHGLRGRI